MKSPKKPPPKINTENFLLEIEVKDTDTILKVRNGGRLRWMAKPQVGGMAMEMSMKPRFLKTKGPVGIISCSKQDLVVYNYYIRAFRGSGRQFATSIKTNGTL